MEEEITNTSYDNMASCRKSEYHSYENFFFICIFVCINIDMYVCVYFFTYFFLSFPSYPTYLLCNIRCYKSSKPYILILNYKILREEYDSASNESEHNPKMHETISSWRQPVFICMKNSYTMLRESTISQSLSGS